MRNSKPFSLCVLLLALACPRIFTKRIVSKVDVTQSQETDCSQGCPCTFSPEILQDGAVKGLRFDLKEFREVSDREEGEARSFHAEGPKTEEARKPTVENLVRGI